MEGKTIMNFKVKTAYPGNWADLYSGKQSLSGYPDGVILPA